MKASVLTSLAFGAAMLAAAATSSAATGTINFTGSVSGTTCTVAGGTGTSPDFTVTMPSVAVGALDAADKVAGGTVFQIRLTACTVAAGATGTALTYFEPGASVDLATGRLKNTAAAATAAKNVQIGLLNDDGSNITVGSATHGSKAVTLEGADGAKAATLRYIAQYVATGGAAEAGQVASNVLYSMVYN